MTDTVEATPEPAPLPEIMTRESGNITRDSFAERFTARATGANADGMTEQVESKESVPEGTEAAPEGAEETAPQAGDREEEESHEEPPESEAIVPPASWSADDKAEFANLPPKVQETIARRESERDRAFQSKTSELADQRRQHDEASEKARTAWAEHVGDLENLHGQIRSAVLGSEQEPDWAAIIQNEGAEAHALKRAEWEQREKLLRSIYENVQMAKQKHTDEAEKTFLAWADAERTKLVEAIPEWADPEKGPALRKEMVGYLLDLGFSEQEMNGLVDHRHYRLIVDAIRGRRAKESAPTTEQKIRKAQKMATPGTSKPRQTSEQRQADEARNAFVQSGGRNRAAGAAMFGAKYGG